MSKLEHVDVSVAVSRMYIYAGQLNITEKDNLAHTLMCGHSVAYTACDTFGKSIGRTSVRPEDSDPVTLVTEVNS